MAVLVLLISTTISAQSKQETAVSNAVEKLRTAMVSGERAALDATFSGNILSGF